MGGNSQLGQTPCVGLRLSSVSISKSFSMPVWNKRWFSCVGAFRFVPWNQEGIGEGKWCIVYTCLPIRNAWKYTGENQENYVKLGSQICREWICYSPPEANENRHALLLVVSNYLFRQLFKKICKHIISKRSPFWCTDYCISHSFDSSELRISTCYKLLALCRLRQNYHLLM